MIAQTITHAKKLRKNQTYLRKWSKFDQNMKKKWKKSMKIEHYGPFDPLNLYKIKKTILYVIIRVIFFICDAKKF